MIISKNHYINNYCNNLENIVSTNEKLKHEKIELPETKCILDLLLSFKTLSWIIIGVGLGGVIVI